MLSSNVKNAAGGLTDIMTSNGMELSPLPDSPLAELVAAGYLPEMDIPTIEQTRLKEEYSQRMGGLDVSSHDLNMEEIVTVAATTTQHMVFHARNVALPMITEVHTQVSDALATMSAVSAVREPEIQVDIMEAPYNNALLHGLVRRYENAAKAGQPRGTLNFPDLTPAQLMDVVLTKIERLDTDVTKLTTTIGGDVLSAVYRAYFQTGGADVYLEEVSTKRIRDLVLFLLARTFMDNPPEGAEGDLYRINNTLSILMEQSGRAIYFTLKDHETRIKNNRLILKTERNMVRVDNVVYLKWLAAGGRPEILYGALMDHTADLSYAGLLANAPMFIGLWDRAVRLRELAQSSNRVTDLRTAARTVMSTYITTVKDQESVVVDEATLRVNLNAALKSTELSGQTDTWKYTTCIVCKTFFPHTDSLSILQEIEATRKRDPSLSSREAATLVTINKVADWVCSMIHVELPKRG